MPLSQEKDLYTYADYLTWGENERIELLDGRPVMMAPPSRLHQEIVMELSRQLANFLEGKPCKIYPAPFAVRLFEGQDDKPENVSTVLEPDITVVCDMNKLDDRGCKGAPDLIIEVLSPSTARSDRLVKLGQYQKAGVREYWIVSPVEQTVQTYGLQNGHFVLSEVYTRADIAKVDVLSGCFVELAKVFPDEAAQKRNI